MARQKKDYKKLYQKERKRLSNVRSELRRKGFDFIELDLPTVKEVESQGLDYKKLYQKLNRIRGAKKIGAIKTVHLDTGEEYTVKEARAASRQSENYNVRAYDRVYSYIQNLPDYREFWNKRARLRARLSLVEHKQRMIQILDSAVRELGIKVYDEMLYERYTMIGELIDGIIQDSQEEVVRHSIISLYKQIQPDGVMVQDLHDAEDIDSYYENA
jgi:hypothetical protein